MWLALPEDARPALVVFGESLGSYGGSPRSPRARTWSRGPTEHCSWARPISRNRGGRITQQRDPGSLERLPIVDEGRNIRFAAHPDDANLPGGAWEFPRIVFWQHGSDPITWWSFDLVLHKPDWLREPLGPDVDPGMRWIPFVTFWQVTLDMVFSAEVPDGYGHSYGPEAADLWADILAPGGMDAGGHRRRSRRTGRLNWGGFGDLPAGRQDLTRR